MRYTDGVRVAAATLIENPLRSFLTFLGIGIGVTAVLLVISVIDGLNFYMEDVIADDFGSDTFLVNRFGMIKNRDDFMKAIKRNKRIRLEDARAIQEQATLLDGLTVMIFDTAPIRYKREWRSGVSIKATWAESAWIGTDEVAAGRMFTVAENASNARVCVIGSEVADELFAPLDPLNREVQIYGRSFRVIGIGEARGSAFGQSRDNYVIIPFNTYDKIKGTRRGIDIQCKAKTPGLILAAVDEVRSIMRGRNHLSLEEDDNFGIITGDSILSFWEDLTQMIFRVALFIVSISLVVGGIVIMNIMMLTVVERTREIGVRKAVGARQRDIEFQFLVESVLLCAIGGLTGVLMGWAMTWGVRNFTPLPARFPIWAPFLAVSVTSAVGIFFGLHPARRAGKLDPIEALRSEQV